MSKIGAQDNMTTQRIKYVPAVDPGSASSIVVICNGFAPGDHITE